MVPGVAALLAVIAGPAAAMLQCHHYDEMVAEATMVMQIAPTDVTGPDPAGNCTVTGTIVRSFKGPHPAGTLVGTMVPCDNPQMLIGATIWQDAAALRRARIVELHIAPTGGPAGYGAGVLLLDAETDAPTLTSFCR
ncbi:MAG: hypothetical protein GW886_09700 [Rhodobacterales bacterium]|nr:hypothetical protein [Rhodobacterales bacterium]